MKRLIFLTLLVGVLGVSSAAFAQKTDKVLRVAIPFSLAPPLLIDQKGEISGLVKEYSEEIGTHLKTQIEVVVYPKFRIDELIAKGLADANCFTSREWVSNPDRFLFTQPMFYKREVIVSIKNPPRSLRDLKGKTVGTVLQYIYPKVDPYFSRKEITREDAPSEENNLQKLLSGRLNYAISDEFHLDYFLKRNPQLKLAKQRLLVQEYPIQCLVAQKWKGILPDLEAAISTLKTKGEFEKLFAKYR